MMNEFTCFDVILAFWKKGALYIQSVVVIMSFPRHTHFPLCQCAFFEKCDKEFDNRVIIGAKELWVPVQQTELNLCLQNLEVCSRPLVHLSGSKCGKAFQGGKKGSDCEGGEEI